MMNDTWRYIEDGLCDGRWNMAVDQALLRSCERGNTPPTLRLYGWESPVLTVGYSQNLEREVKQCLGVPCVRRPTGGRALLHHRELTYSLVAPVDHPRFSGGLKQTFSAISQALLLGLRELGIDQARINDQKKIQHAGRRSPACFASLNHCEITVQNRKLVGSAQRRTHGAFLQHGSIPIAASTWDFHSFLRYDNEEARLADSEKMKRFTTTLNAVCGESVSFERARSALRAGFETCFAGNWAAGGLTSAEKNHRDRILESADSATPAIFSETFVP